MLRLFSLVLFLFVGSNAFAAQMPEQEKINSLLDALTTSNITFIRNGEEHDGAWAKNHLAEKLKDAKPAVTTADEFITKVASKSSESGQPYTIKMANGKTMESGDWLKMKLAGLMQPSAGLADMPAEDAPK